MQKKVGRRAVSDMKYDKMLAAISGWGNCEIFFLFGFFLSFPNYYNRCVLCLKRLTFVFIFKNEI